MGGLSAQRHCKGYGVQCTKQGTAHVVWTGASPLDRSRRGTELAPTAGRADRTEPIQDRTSSVLRSARVMALARESARQMSDPAARAPDTSHATPPGCYAP